MNSINDNNPKDNRTRTWIMVLYPESAPENWLSQLRDLHITLVISPLHDKDVDAEGKLKKAHYHILLDFGTQKKSFTQVKSITDSLSCPIPQICNSKKGQIRYFIHYDDPDKYQYSKSDIQTYGQIDLDEYFQDTINDLVKLEKEIIDYCIMSNTFEYCDLVDYAIENNVEWYKHIRKNTYHIKSYLNSRRYKKRDRELRENYEQANTPGEIMKALNDIEKTL